MSGLLSVEGQRQHLLEAPKDPKRNSVTFNYKSEKTKLKGKLKDRWVVLDSDNPEKDDPIYWNLIDLIEFENKDWLRIGYYRYVKDTERLNFTNKNHHWVFAGQTALTDPIPKIITLFVETAKEKRLVQGFFK